MRNYDIAGCARLIKPTSRKSHSYSATWFKPRDGERRRPNTTKEVCISASQEFAKLMKEPTNKWSHPLVTPYTHAHGRARGSLNLHALCNATPPVSVNRKITLAYMEPTSFGFSIIYWPRATINIISHTTVMGGNCATPA